MAWNVVSAENKGFKVDPKICNLSKIAIPKLVFDLYHGQKIRVNTKIFLPAISEHSSIHFWIRGVMKDRKSSGTVHHSWIHLWVKGVMTIRFDVRLHYCIYPERPCIDHRHRGPVPVHGVVVLRYWLFRLWYLLIYYLLMSCTWGFARVCHTPTAHSPHSHSQHLLAPAPAQKIEVSL